MEHGRVDHFLTTYQEVLRVPLLIRGPGIPRGMRISAPVSLVDVAPTILGLANAPRSASMDGLDLSPLWLGEEANAFEERFLYGEAGGGLTFDAEFKGLFPIYRSVRRGRYKLVHESKQDTRRLYDLLQDPGETRDVSAEQPQIAATLQEELTRRHRAPLPETSPNNRVVLDPEEVGRLRALGYAP